MPTRNDGRRATFERRHYAAVADIVRCTRARSHASPEEVWADLTEEFCRRSAADNGNFQRVMFKHAWTGEMNGHDFKTQVGR
jgi:hypothetical protein